jgi:hypothetical protein
VKHLRRRDGDHPAAGQPDPLREVQTRSNWLEEDVEPLKTLSKIAAHQHRDGRDESDFTNYVVLLEIDFAFVKARIRLAEDIGGAAYRLELIPSAGNEELGAPERSVVTLHLRHERG